MTFPSEPIPLRFPNIVSPYNTALIEDIRQYDPEKQSNFLQVIDPRRLSEAELIKAYQDVAPSDIIDQHTDVAMTELLIGLRYELHALQYPSLVNLLIHQNRNEKLPLTIILKEGPSRYNSDSITQLREKLLERIVKPEWLHNTSLRPENTTMPVQYLQSPYFVTNHNRNGLNELNGFDLFKVAEAGNFTLSTHAVRSLNN